MEYIIPYECLKCGITENILREVVEYFDEMDQSNIDEPPCFSYENMMALWDLNNTIRYMEKIVSYN